MNATIAPPLRDRRARLFPIDHFPSHTSIHHEILTGDKARLGGQQERHQRRNIVRLTDAPHRMLRMIRREQRAVPPIDPAGADAVDPDVRPQTDRQGMGLGNQAPLGCRIRLGVRLGLQGAGRGDVDDGAPTGPQQRDAVLDHEQTAR